jgi:NhaA family Na+:H+ antiporter
MSANRRRVPSVEEVTVPEPDELPASFGESHRFVPRTFVQPVLSFMRLEASGGIVMLVAAVAALVWANSAWGEHYFALLETRVEIGFGDFHFHHLSELTVQQWVNDALMAIFFFVVGLEIKRELVAGELRDPRAAALPAIAALGGMLVPAAIYLALNAGGDGGSGWGIPVATDIAFAIGVVSLVGSRVPITAKLFLLALAIVDDIGGILIIAIFYTDELAFGWLAAGAVGFLLIHVMKRMAVRSLIVYAGVALFTWLAVLESGVHATIAGVALGLMTPARSFYDPRYFPRRARQLVDRVDEYIGGEPRDHATMDRVDSLMGDLRRLTRESLPPLDRLEHELAPLTSFIIVPVFAFANAGVLVSADVLAGALSDRVLLGVGLGLLVGKAVGVTGAAWLAVRLGVARLPRGVTWRHIEGLALLAGVGFTVALFIAALSFPLGSDQLASAKIGIFMASIIAGSAGFLWLRRLPVPQGQPAREGTTDRQA